MPLSFEDGWNTGPGIQSGQTEATMIGLLVTACVNVALSEPATAEALVANGRPFYVNGSTTGDPSAADVVVTAGLGDPGAGQIYASVTIGGQAWSLHFSPMASQGGNLVMLSARSSS